MKYTDKKSIIAAAIAIITFVQIIIGIGISIWVIFGNKGIDFLVYFTIFVYKPVNMKNGKELKPIALEIIM
jgi:hypothetical protein